MIEIYVVTPARIPTSMQLPWSTGSVRYRMRTEAEPKLETSWVPFPIMRSDGNGLMSIPYAWGDSRTGRVAAAHWWAGVCGFSVVTL